MIYLKPLQKEHAEMMEIINSLFEAGHITELKRIRHGYTQWLPLELIHIPDRELCEHIDKLIKQYENRSIETTVEPGR